MTDKTSHRLSNNISKIMNIWEQRALHEIFAAHHQETLALRNSLPVYLSQLVDALSTTIDRTTARKRFDKDESTRIGKKHGRERAEAVHYTMDQMILEYHILRQVICDVLEEDALLTPIEREVIVCSIEQAVNDAATQYSDTLRDLQDKIAHTLAHDLRNPLTSAKVNAQLIMRKSEDAKYSLERATRVANSLDRIDKMICELLDASRINAGENLPLEFADCDLDWLVREVAYDFNEIYTDRFTVQSSENCFGKWNQDGLHRLIENLATNAIKHGKENSVISLSLEHDESTVTISVYNEGDPIPLHEQQTLFEKFKRSRTAEDKIGWGLGLTVVKGMVDAHRGSITLESEKDKGTTFKIRLPKNPLENSTELNSNSKNNIGISQARIQ